MIRAGLLCVNRNPESLANHTRNPAVVQTGLCIRSDGICGRAPHLDAPTARNEVRTCNTIGRLAGTGLAAAPSAVDRPPLVRLPGLLPPVVRDGFGAGVLLALPSRAMPLLRGAHLGSIPSGGNPDWSGLCTDRTGMRHLGRDSDSARAFRGVDHMRADRARCGKCRPPGGTRSTVVVYSRDTVLDCAGFHGGGPLARGLVGRLTTGARPPRKAPIYVKIRGICDVPRDPPENRPERVRFRIDGNEGTTA